MFTKKTVNHDHILRLLAFVWYYCLAIMKFDNRLGNKGTKTSWIVLNRMALNNHTFDFDHFHIWATDFGKFKFNLDRKLPHLLNVAI